jgi:hypothetical protein
VGPNFLKIGNRVTCHHFVLVDVGVEMMVDAECSHFGNRGL